jgi:hypothetical protein
LVQRLSLPSKSPEQKTPATFSTPPLVMSAGPPSSPANGPQPLNKVVNDHP